MKRVVDYYIVAVISILLGLVVFILWPKDGENKTAENSNNDQHAPTEPDYQNTGDETDLELAEDAEIDEAIVDWAEVDPAFPGGESAMQEFIRDNFVYPESARENGEQGTVFVQFVVGTDGSIGNVTVVKGVSPSLDREAKRVVKKMPNWLPGKQDGELVRVRYTLPISCRIS